MLKWSQGWIRDHRPPSSWGRLPPPTPAANWPPRQADPQTMSSWHNLTSVQGDSQSTPRQTRSQLTQSTHVCRNYCSIFLSLPTFKFQMGSSKWGHFRLCALWPSPQQLPLPFSEPFPAPEDGFHIVTTKPHGAHTQHSQSLPRKFGTGSLLEARTGHFQLTCCRAATLCHAPSDAEKPSPRRRGGAEMRRCPGCFLNSQKAETTRRLQMDG